MRAAPLLPWEFGKYAIVAILGLGLVFTVRLRRPALALSYAGLLLPSAILTVSGAGRGKFAVR